MTEATTAENVPHDEQWKGLAESTREALTQLGYDIGPRCLPGEPDYCGGSFARHAVAHLAALTAVTNHHLAHMTMAYGIDDMSEWGGPAYENVSHELAQGCNSLALADLGEFICDIIKGDDSRG